MTLSPEQRAELRNSCDQATRLFEGGSEFVASLTALGRRARDAIPALLDALAEAEKGLVEWINGYPDMHRAQEWFLAVMKRGDRVVLKALPEEYTYDFKTADDTYVKKENVVRWASFPDSEFLLPREELSAATARADALAAENAGLRDAAEKVAAEFEGTIQQYHKIGPDMTCADGEFFCVSTILDREELISDLRSALKGATNAE